MIPHQMFLFNPKWLLVYCKRTKKVFPTTSKVKNMTLSGHPKDVGGYPEDEKGVPEHL